MKILNRFLCSLLIVFSLSNFSYAQPLQCVTDLTWQVGTNQNGPFNGTPVEVSTSCLDPVIISCVCPSNTLPNIGTCDEAMEIWGEGPDCVNNVPCTYPAATYWFRKVIDLDDCQQFSDYHIQVQGDNSMTFLLNGVNVLQTTNGQWNVTFDTNGAGTANQNFNTAVGNALVSGPNEILIGVTNLNGGCMNYAFLSFCADFIVEDINLDADFTLSNIDNGNSTFDVIGTPTNPTAGENHEWYILSRPSNTIDPFTPVGVFPGPDVLDFTSPYCLDYRVIHRVFIDNCEACFAKNNGGVCEGEEVSNDAGENEEERLEPVPCDILDEYEWPIIGRPDDRPDVEGGGRNSEQKDIQKQSSIDVSPNPAKSNFSLTWDIAEPTTLQVFAIDGQLVLDQALSDGQTYLLVDANRWNTGIYIVQIIDKQGKNYTQRVEVVK